MSIEGSFDLMGPYADTLIQVDERKSKVRIFGLVVIIHIVMMGIMIDWMIVPLIADLDYTGL